MALRLALLQITLISSILFSQIKFEPIFEKKYSELPFNVRIENSGIYSISSYDVSDKEIAFKSYDNNLLYKFNRENSSLETSLSNYRYDAVIKSELYLAKGLNKSVEQPHNFKKVFSQNDFQLLADDNGIITSADGVVASVNVTPEKLEIYTQYLTNNYLTVTYPKTLAYASIIGIDRNNNHFIIVEEFESHIPLKVLRRILAINSAGNILSQLEIPNVKYLTLLKEFDIDTNGNLYHLYSTDEGITLFKISGLTVKSDNLLKYPNKLNKNIHFNNYVKTDEYLGDQPSGTELASSRLAAVKLGEIYVLHKYKTTSANLAPVNTTDPNGDIVRTPAWLIEGLNAKVPYKWGGFQTIAQFDAGLVAGKYAGDIHTSGVSTHAVGVDCSGFVSRCWQLTYHSATSMMPDITTQYSDWNLLKPGDAIHKVGHVRLFLERNPNGSFRIVEASARDWGVAYWSYTASDLATYTPRYYNNMESDFSLNRPTLQRAEIVTGNEIKLHWTLDTTNVTAIKIYSSKNGKDWTFLKTESPSANSTNIIQSNEHYSYRISTIISNSSQSEGNWSNVLSVKNNGSTEKILIVDGFERDNGSGSWQGPGHTFVSKYAEPLNLLNKNIESLKNNVLINSQISLSNYKSIYWILGDESTEHETFSNSEQTLVQEFLRNGGNLFVSGSEIGWDLSYRGTASDKSFYNDYLKAVYVADGSGGLNAEGISGSIFDGLSVRYGQTYEEDYPDVINVSGGSSLVFKYSNDKGAGIAYKGSFGNSSNQGAIIHFGFPVETIANDTLFNLLITKADNYFDGITGIESENLIPNEFTLYQNYPNPFNPTTTIEYFIPSIVKVDKSGKYTVVLRVFDVLGKEVFSLVNGEKSSGRQSIVFDAKNLSSGIYYYKLEVGNYHSTKKMIILK